MRLALGWKRLSIYLYYLVIVNMLSFNRRFVIVLLRTILERNQILTEVFKNVKMLKILFKCEFLRVAL